jgi:hypothetical protein
MLVRRKSFPEKIRKTKERKARPMAREFSKSSHKPSHNEIAQRAYDIFVERGRPEGRDLDHWLEAEAQLTHVQQTPAGSSRSTRSSVRLQAQKPY